MGLGVCEAGFGLGGVVGGGVVVVVIPGVVACGVIIQLGGGSGEDSGDEGRGEE